VATELGLEDADAAIDANLYADAVATATAQAHSLGINAIPAFVLDQRLIVLGAQPDEVFARAFAQLTPRT
jgi:predicted DsbA family dithiol-disulfide isomerase